MIENSISLTEINTLYSKIVNLISSKKTVVAQTLNTAMIFLYWEIGEVICNDILKNSRADYGKTVVNEVSDKLKQNYGKGFNRASIFRMIQFYQEFPDREIVATLSRQLTWSHFVEILPIENQLKRDFYAAMSKNENWAEIL